MLVVFSLFFTILLTFCHGHGRLPNWKASYPLSPWSVSRNFATHFATGSTWTSAVLDEECLTTSKFLDFTTNIVYVKSEGSKKLVVGIMHKLCGDGLSGVNDEYPGAVPNYCNNHQGFGYASVDGDKLSHLGGEVSYGDGWFSQGVDFSVRTYVDFSEGTVGFYRAGVYQGVAYDGVNFIHDFVQGVVVAVGAFSDVSMTIELNSYNCQKYPVTWVSHNNLWTVGGKYATIPKHGTGHYQTGWLSEPCIYPPAKKFEFTIKITERIRDGSHDNWYIGIMDTQCIDGLDNSGYERLGYNDLCPNSWGYVSWEGKIYKSNSGSTYASTWMGEGNIIRTVVDFKLGLLSYFINGNFQGYAKRGLDFKRDLNANPPKYPKGITGAFTQHYQDRSSIELLEYICYAKGDLGSKKI